MECVDLIKSFTSLSMFLLPNLLFESDPFSNAYLVAKIGVDTAENELRFLAKNALSSEHIQTFLQTKSTHLD